MRLIVVILFLVASAQVWADVNADDVPQWETICRGESHLKAVRARSRSGAPVNDDMAIELEWNDGSLLSVPLPEAWYLRRVKLAAPDNTCDGIGAFTLGKDRLILAIAFNDRPDWDHLALALIDTKVRKVLDVISDAGEVPDSFKHARVGDLVSFAVFKYWQRSSDGSEEGVQQMRDVVVSGNRLRLSWQK